ncbi:hypothetical protein OAN19_01640 [Flavobacteriaceae bacterium]|nr:hypothetical protein [Flavobacteriaceae bacterium]
MEKEIIKSSHSLAKVGGWCTKCQKYVTYWIDDTCTVCNDKPNTDDILALTYQRLGSLKKHLTFYTVIIAINMIVILIALISGGF